MFLAGFLAQHQPHTFPNGTFPVTAQRCYIKSPRLPSAVYQSELPEMNWRHIEIRLTRPNARKILLLSETHRVTSECPCKSSMGQSHKFHFYTSSNIVLGKNIFVTVLQKTSLVIRCTVHDSNCALDHREQRSPDA